MSVVFLRPYLDKMLCIGAMRSVYWHFDIKCLYILYHTKALPFLGLSGSLAIKNQRPSFEVASQTRVLGKDSHVRYFFALLVVTSREVKPIIFSGLCRD